MQVQVVVVVPGQRDLHLTRSPAFALEPLVHVHFRFIVLLRGHDHAAADVLLRYHGSMLGERSIVGVRPCLSDIKFRPAFLFAWNPVFRACRGVIFWVGLNKAKFEKIAIASFITLLPRRSFCHREFAQLRHRNEQAHLTSVKPDARTRAVFIEQGLCTQLCLTLLPVAVQQVNAKPPQAEAGTEGDGVDHAGVFASAP